MLKYLMLKGRKYECNLKHSLHENLNKDKDVTLTRNKYDLNEICIHASIQARIERKPLLVHLKVALYTEVNV